MAELSNADKRAILGEGYEEVLAKAQQEGRAHSSDKQLWAAEVQKCENRQFSAFAITVVGAVLFVSDYYEVSGPSVMLVGAFGIAALIVGIGWYVHLWKALRKLRADRPAN